MNGDEQVETREALADYNIGRVLQLLDTRLSKIENWIKHLEVGAKQILDKNENTSQNRPAET